MLETMFRSGVPPHIGQSAFDGSDRAISASVLSENAAAAAMSFLVMYRAPELPSNRATELSRSRIPVLEHLDVVPVELGSAAGLRRRIGIESGTTLEAANRIDALDRPRLRLGFAPRPYLASRAHLPASHRLYFQLHRVPSVLLPLEVHPGRPRRLGLPGL